MKLMCLNGWGGKLSEALLPYIAKEAPDVLCLQEVVHTPATKKTSLMYRDIGIELPQRANFFSDICDVLPNHKSIFCPAAEGDLWDGDQAIASQWGLATFVSCDIPIIAQHQGFVHGEFSANGYGDHPRSRSAHGVRLYDLELGHAIVIAHMHGLRDLAGKHDTLERATQARRLAALTNAITKPGDRVVVCGDFNVELDSDTFAILGEIGLTDLIASHGITDTRTSHYKKPGRFADYMLVNSTVKVLSFEAVTAPEVSDHRPLVLHIG